MLDLLVKYATEHGLTAEPGFKPKRARWALVFDPRGRFLNVQELGEVGVKRNPGREFLRCPDLSQPEIKAGGSGCRHFLVDNAEVVALLTKGQPSAKLRAKHDYFVGLLRQASDTVPVLGPIAAQLGDPENIERIRAELTTLGARPTENVTPAVLDGGVRFLVESDQWHSWWRDFRARLAGQRRSRRQRASQSFRMRCFASGQLIEPTLTHPKVEGLADVGGLSMGDALASFKQGAFKSFGLEQSANAAVSEEMAAAYRAALNHLIREHGRRLGAAKVVYWYSGKVPESQDPVLDLERGDLEDEWGDDEPTDPVGLEADAQERARSLAASFSTGEDSDLLNYRYYMLMLSGASGRVMVRDWFEGQLGQLRENRDAWFDDLAIIHRDGRGRARRPKFMAVMGALVRELDYLPAPLVAKMWRAAARAEPIPHEAMASALARARADVTLGDAPRHARMGLLRAYHVRKGDRHMQPQLNEEHPNPAYQCGRLMAILADIQRAALGEVGAGVVERYFAAASSTPALVLGRLTRTAQFHLASIRQEPLRLWFDNRFAAIWARIKDRIPRTLTLEEQSLFALGYYQQKAARRKAGSDRAETENAT